MNSTADFYKCPICGYEPPKLYGMAEAGADMAMHTFDEHFGQSN